MDREDHDLASLEASLERLMPRGLGDDARLELEAVVDSLASEVECGVEVSKIVERASLGSRFSRLFSSGQPTAVAAALALFAIGAVGAVGFFAKQQGSLGQSDLAQIDGVEMEQGDGIEILEQVTWISGGADLGVRALGDEGDVGRGWIYSGVEEERILHESSGYEVILQRDFEAELYAASSL